MKVLLTGAKGFLAKNLKIHLQFLSTSEIDIFEYTRESSDEDLIDYIKASDFIFHLAGENRPKEVTGFVEGNARLTQKICDYCLQYNSVPILYTSSTQTALDNDYGKSKRMAEDCLQKYAEHSGQAVYLYRLPNVFGKWTRPNYNSFVATLCHNISRDLPVTINDRNSELSLVYVDDVMTSFIGCYNNYHKDSGIKLATITPIYKKTLGDIVDLIQSFKDTPNTLLVPDAASGFTRALYSTYMSYLPKDDFIYDLDDYTDERGSFYEVLKTKNSGQISISTTAPGITRGQHFHHSKNEKFLVVSGRARFQFRHIITNEVIELTTDSSKKQMVNIPTGYTHNFTNVGETELIMLLWANEAFNREKPDTQFLEV